MSPKKVSLVVLATLVIFASGVVTGGLLIKRTTLPVRTPGAPFWGRFEMLRRSVGAMEDLTPAQRDRIDGIIRDNQELLADYFRILEPDVQQVFRKMRENIRAELTPPQRREFEELVAARRQQLRPGGQRQQNRLDQPPPRFGQPYGQSPSEEALPRPRRPGPNPGPREEAPKPQPPPP